MDNHHLFGSPITLGLLADRLKTVYRGSHRAERAVFLHGPPGTGKTSVTRQVAADLGVGYVRNNLVTTDYMKIGGLPDKQEGQKRRLGRPVCLPLIDIPDKGEGLFVLDDFTHSMRDIQNCALDITIERRLSDSRLGPGWLIVFCGNDTGGVFPLSAGLANRFTHYYVEADLEIFKSWGIRNGILPQILSFLESEPDTLSVVPQQQEMAYPTPRSWHRASGDLRDVYGEDLTGDDQGIRSIVTSEVGSAAAARFMAHLRTYHLINFEDITTGTAPSLDEQAQALGIERSTAVHALSFSLLAHARGWWTRTARQGPKTRAPMDATIVGRLLVYLQPAYGSKLLRDLTNMDRARALRMADRAASEPGLSHVRDAFVELGKLQAGVGVV